MHRNKKALADGCFSVDAEALTLVLSMSGVKGRTTNPAIA